MKAVRCQIEMGGERVCVFSIPIRIAFSEDIY